MDSYTRAAVERAMKVQDVMLQAMAKKITWWQAAEILGIGDRHMWRWRERYEQEGYNGLLDRRRGKPSRRRVPLAVVEQVLGLYREKYFDMNVQHFHEKLEAEHGIELSYTWSSRRCREPGWWRGDASGECTASSGCGGPWRGCCCTSTAAVTSGCRTSAGTT
jgi:transposase